MKGNSLGTGLNHEIVASRMRVRMATAAAAATAPSTVPRADAPVAMRKVLVFNPKLPMVAKKQTPPAPAGGGAKKTRRVVLKINMKSQMLQRRLNL